MSITMTDRASKPESSADALKLLQDLQTYHVDLDLLYEQIKVNEYEIPFAGKLQLMSL